MKEIRYKMKKNSIYFICVILILTISIITSASTINKDEEANFIEYNVDYQ